MQDLVDAVRATGATNMLMVSGLEWTNDMREWLAYKPNDPPNNIAASWHAYSFNACATESCWDSQIAPLAQQVPVVLGEFGQDNCGFDYMQRAGDLGRRARPVAPALDLEPVGLRHAPHQGLERHPGARLRRGLQGPPAHREPVLISTSIEYPAAAEAAAATRTPPPAHRRNRGT